jgi:flagellar basal body-associated protein FliL
VIQNISEKEAHLKDLVVKLLQERNFSDFDMLDSLFAEIKQELQNPQKNTN